MRVAALFDVHANLTALDAVLAEVERERPDAIVVGGDVAWGPMPVETLDRLLTLPTTPLFLRGNTDREIVELHEGTFALPPWATGDTSWVDGGRWAAHELTDAHRELLRTAPLTVTLDVDGLGPTLFCHASPRRDDEVITRLTTDERLARIVAGTPERVVVGGHTHVQFDRALDGRRVLNAGSVGFPSEGRPGAYWLLLGPGVELRRTPYDLDEAATRARAAGYPGAHAFVERITAEDPTLADVMSDRLERYAIEHQ